MNVVGIDPGKLTGIFSSALNMGWEVEPDQVVAILDEMLDCPGSIDVIGMEKYVMRPQGKGRRMTAQPDALDVMGRVRQYAEDHGIELVEAQPNVTKRIVPDKLLRRARWKHTTRDGHADDGARAAGWAILVKNPEEFAKIFKM